MKVAIHQPNFIPWLGYFNKIKDVDKFVFFDDVQFERGKSFTNRSKIVINGNESWLTIPIIGKSNLSTIKDTTVDASFRWKKKILKSLEMTYRKYPFYDEIFSLINTAFTSNSEFLVDYNIPLIESISQYLDFKTTFTRSSCIDSHDKSTTGLSKIIDILKAVDAKDYLSGAGAGSKRYIDESVFIKNDIALHWQQINFPQYPQKGNKLGFIPGLSMLDLLFNQGKKSANYI